MMNIHIFISNIQISQMRENLKLAERERQFLLLEQKNLLRSKTDGLLTTKDTSEDAESADQEKINKIEVLKGLKKIESNQRNLTSKEKKLVERNRRKSGGNGIAS